MSPTPIVYVDTSTIREGKLEELKTAMPALVSFVENNVPRVISYGFFLDPVEGQMTVVAVHPDSECLEFHMDVGNEEFRKFSSLIELSGIDVYGSVSEAVVERLERKAQMLGTGTVTVHAQYAGFDR
jgi:hypothetical protein